MSGSMLHSTRGILFHNYRMRRRRGFTLIEVMTTALLIGLLATLAGSTFGGFLVRSKRVEALIGLNAVWTAQMAHLAQNGRFADRFTELDFQTDNGRLVSAQTYQGTRYVFQLSQPWGPGSFYCIATAQLDDDSWPDVLEVLEAGR